MTGKAVLKMIVAMYRLGMKKDGMCFFPEYGKQGHLCKLSNPGEKGASGEWIWGKPGKA